MLKKDLLSLIESLSENESVLESLSGSKSFIDSLRESESFIDSLREFESFKPKAEDITLELFKEALKNSDISGYHQSLLDSAVSKGVDSFKTKKMPRLIEEEIKKINEKDMTPEQRQIKELQDTVLNMEKEKNKAEMSSKFTKVLSEKKLPAEILDFILSDNEETINQNIDKFEKIFESAISTGVKDIVNNNSYTPPNSKNDNLGKLTWGQVLENPNLYSKYNEQQKQI